MDISTGWVRQTPCFFCGGDTCGTYNTATNVYCCHKDQLYSKASASDREECQEEFDRSGAIINSIIRKCMPLGDSPGENYFRARSLDPSGVRGVYFAESLFLDGSTAPALVIPVTLPDQSTPFLQRIFLSPDCSSKANTEFAKRGCGNFPKGLAVKIYPYDGSGWLGLAEGIESAIAAHNLMTEYGFHRSLLSSSELPTHPFAVWATLGASNMKKFRPPEGVTDLVIFADNDSSEYGGANVGLEAALHLRKTLKKAKINVHILMFGQHNDANDAIKAIKSTAVLPDHSNVVPIEAFRYEPKPGEDDKASIEAKVSSRVVKSATNVYVVHNDVYLEIEGKRIKVGPDLVRHVNRTAKRLSLANPVILTKAQREHVLEDIAHSASELSTAIHLDRVYSRTAPGTDNSIWINLGDSRGFAHVKPGSWELKPSCTDAVMILANQQLPLPDISHTPSPDRFLKLIQYTFSEQLAKVLLACLPAMLLPPTERNTYKMLWLTGPAQSGKTMTMTQLCNVVDPNVAKTPPLPSNQQGFAIYSNVYHLFRFDNADDKMTSDQSDLLCRMITGDDYVSRALYTNDSVHINSIKAPAIISALFQPAGTRSDVRTRSLMFEAALPEPTDEDLRRDVMAEYEACRPEVFAWVLDALAYALKQWQDRGLCEPEDRAREYMTVVRYACEYLGCEPGMVDEFMAQSRADLAHDGIRDSELCKFLVHKLADKPVGYTETSSSTALHLELSDYIRKRHDLAAIDPLTNARRDFDMAMRGLRSPTWMTKTISRFLTDLNAIGIRVRFTRTKHVRTVTITKTREIKLDM